jgi:hypothetical protein
MYDAFDDIIVFLLNNIGHGVLLSYMELHKFRGRRVRCQFNCAPINVGSIVVLALLNQLILMYHLYIALTLQT